MLARRQHLSFSFSHLECLRYVPFLQVLWLLFNSDRSGTSFNPPHPSALYRVTQREVPIFSLFGLNAAQQRDLFSFTMPYHDVKPHIGFFEQTGFSFILRKGELLIQQRCPIPLPTKSTKTYKMVFLDRISCSDPIEAYL